MGSGGTGTIPESTGTGTTTESVAETDTSSGGGGWDERISAEVLKNEITSVRNFLNATVQSVGSYNSSMLMIEPKAASVAALAHIAIQHPGDLSWKEDAPYIRDLAKKMNEAPLQRGAKDKAKIQGLFENMVDTFNHSRPADLEEPPADDGFSDVAEMSAIMTVHLMTFSMP